MAVIKTELIIELVLIFSFFVEGVYLSQSMNQSMSAWFY